MRIPLMLVVLIAGCGTELKPPADDDRPAESVYHDAEAFANAPQWRVADTVDVIYDPGSRLEFDIPAPAFPELFDSGHLVVLAPFPPARLMLFGPDGQPDRLLATTGEGPGELRFATAPLVAGDSILVVDRNLNRSSWFTMADGFVGSVRTEDPRCLNPIGLLPDRRLLAINGCVMGADSLPDGETRLPMPLAVVTQDFRDVDTIAEVPGVPLRPIETRYGGRRARSGAVVRLGPQTVAKVWGDEIVVATNAEGYVLERYDAAGPRRGRIEVARARRPVTEAIREFVVAEELAKLDELGSEGMVDPTESRRLAREEPIADSLPFIAGMTVDADGTLWVGDMHLPVEGDWQLTGFRKDGSIVARLSGPARSESCRFAVIASCCLRPMTTAWLASSCGGS